MKKIKFVKVDYRDRRPTTDYPARHGPDNPVPGIQQLWFERGEPTRYFGLAPDDADLTTPGVLREISESEWAELVEQWRADMLNKLADVRFVKETAGVELPGGSRIRTDRESQAQINSAYTTLRDGMVDAADFKGANGWVAITLTEITPIATAVARHVQPCFTAERRVSEQVEAAATAEELVAINLEAAFAAELEAVKAAQKEGNVPA